MKRTHSRLPLTNDGSRVDTSSIPYQIRTAELLEENLRRCRQQNEKHNRAAA